MEIDPNDPNASEAEAPAPCHRCVWRQAEPRLESSPRSVICENGHVVRWRSWFCSNCHRCLRHNAPAICEACGRLLNCAQCTDGQAQPVSLAFLIVQGHFVCGREDCMREARYAGPFGPILTYSR